MLTFRKGCWLIGVTDQAYPSRGVTQLDDGVGVGRGHAVVGKDREYRRGLNTHP